MKIVKILWIDDSIAWSESVQGNLKIVGQRYGVDFRFVNAINGENIVFKCSNFDFDIIIMDYDMEPFSGEKYIADIREEEHLESLQILFYSQNNSIDLRNLVKDFNGVTCLYRPNLEDKIISLFCH